MAGLLIGLLVAWCTDFAAYFVIARHGVPDLAISACLVAGVSALAIWAAWLLIRYSTRAVSLLMPIVMFVINFVFDIAQALMGSSSSR